MYDILIHIHVVVNIINNYFSHQHAHSTEDKSKFAELNSNAKAASEFNNMWIGQPYGDKFNLTVMNNTATEDVPETFERYETVSVRQCMKNRLLHIFIRFFNLTFLILGSGSNISERALDVIGF